MKFTSYLLMTLILLTGITTIAQSDKTEELRKLRQQMIEENKSLQQQQEWNNQNAQQEIKKLNEENRQKSFEVQSSKQEAQRAKIEYEKAKRELQLKQAELQNTQQLIELAKLELAQTDSLLQSAEMRNRIILEEKRKQEDSLVILKKEQQVNELQLKAQKLELQAQQAKTRLYIIVAAISLSLFSIIGVLFASRQKTLRELHAKNQIIEEEKKRSDELLLNVLPEEVMHELKASGRTQARNYPNATVLFADIKGFTKISEKLSPDELIEALDTYFERFDKVIEKYGIEKIKTIGDAYVCAGGIPSKNICKPETVVKAALEFQDEVAKLRIEREKLGKQTFEFRIGLHTGPLIAGVIGVKKFAYDIWGDTVNMAARMQQESEAGKVNISQDTYELVKDSFACVHRGKHDAKNKGEVDMYFVEKAVA